MIGLKSPISGNISLGLYRPTAGDGCVLWFPGQDDAYSATIRDRSGYVNNGAIIGAVWARTPGGLWCLDYDGIDDYLSIPHSALWNFGSGDFTIILWINKTVIESVNNHLIGHFNASLVGWYLTIQYPAADKMQFRTNNNTMILEVTHSIQAGEWASIATVKANNTLTIYVDTVNKGSAGLSSVQAVTHELWIGTGDYSGHQFFKGSIALPRIYNRGLSALEVQNCYNRERHLFGV